MKLSKQQVILNHIVTNDRQAIFCERLDESTLPRRLSFKAGDWADMGSPEVITVTIEPADLLNDEPAL
jgi:hypothetical protein